jgi:mRNA-degrading endonuclease toxin of MazEF toxin-antitoxin module
MGETGLHRDSVSMPTLVTAVDLDQIAEYVGRLRAGRLREVIEGVQRVIEPPRLHAGQA